MSDKELSIKVECGAVVKELDPDIPEQVQNALPDEDKIYRYKFCTIASSIITGVKRKLTKDEHVTGSEAHRPKTQFLRRNKTFKNSSCDLNARVYL